LWTQAHTRSIAAVILELAGDLPANERVSSPETPRCQKKECDA